MPSVAWRGLFSKWTTAGEKRNLCTWFFKYQMIQSKVTQIHYIVLDSSKHSYAYDGNVGVGLSRAGMGWSMG